jgi:hypothetical protein
MRLPPLLKEHPRWLQALLAVVLPAAYGALGGWLRERASQRQPAATET